MQAVAFVLVLMAARARIHAVLSLEILGKFFDVDRFDVTANGVFHLDSVAGILKSNPLHAILVLPHNKRGGCGNGSRSCVGIDVCASPWSTRVHVWASARGPLWWCLRRAKP
jgi:hypothetical protein